MLKAARAMTHRGTDVTHTTKGTAAQVVLYRGGWAGLGLLLGFNTRETPRKRVGTQGASLWGMPFLHCLRSVSRGGGGGEMV